MMMYVIVYVLCEPSKSKRFRLVIVSAIDVWVAYCFFCILCNCKLVLANIVELMHVEPSLKRLLHLEILIEIYMSIVTRRYCIKKLNWSLVS